MVGPYAKITKMSYGYGGVGQFGAFGIRPDLKARLATIQKYLQPVKCMGLESCQRKSAQHPWIYPGDYLNPGRMVFVVKYRVKRWDNLKG